MIIERGAATSGTFTQGGAGAVQRTVQDRLRDRIHVTDFAGADPTGVADSTAAVRAAIAYAQSQNRSSSTGGGPASGSSPEVYFPRGVYKITGEVGQASELNSLFLSGDHAILDVSAGVTFLQNIRYMFYMHGLTVRGGAVGLAIATGNSDTVMITVDECEFINQTSQCFTIDATSNSTQFLVRNSKLCNLVNSAAKAIVALSSDYIKFRDCWLSFSTAAAAVIDAANTNLIMDNNICVPNGVYAWVQMEGLGNLVVNNTRFGGEGGGASFAVIINRMAAVTAYPIVPTTISVRDSDMYTLHTGTPLHLYAIPNHVYITGCRGFIDANAITVDFGVSVADQANIGTENSHFVIKNNSQDYDAYIEPTGVAPDAAREGLMLVEDASVFSSRPLTADLVLQSQAATGGYAPSNNFNDVALSYPVDEFGVSCLNWVATANQGHGDVRYTTALNGFSAGVYTAVFDVTVTGYAVRATFQASYVVHHKPLSRGKHTICIPFYFNGTADQSIRFATYSMLIGAEVEWQRFRIYTGRRVVYSKSAEVSGIAPPTTGDWYRGDRVVNGNVSAAGIPGWICTTAGTPGTWSAEAATLMLAYGTYTPVASSLSNVDSAGFSVAQYSRVGNMVMVSGEVQIDPTAAGSFQFGTTLPIAVTSFSNRSQGAGTFVSSQVAAYCGAIWALESTDKVYFQAVAPDATARTFYYSFMYQVV